RLIPTQSGHPFRSKPAIYSDRIRRPLEVGPMLSPAARKSPRDLTFCHASVVRARNRHFDAAARNVRHTSTHLLRSWRKYLTPQRLGMRNRSILLCETATARSHELEPDATLQRSRLVSSRQS